MKKNAFTLVELIVVITILAILGTIGFISLQGYSREARNSVRISDMKNIEKGLELFILQSGKYPLPDNFTTITASGNIIRYQGIAGSNILKKIGVFGKGNDPKTGEYYSYVVNNQRNKIQISGLLENGYSFINNDVLANEDFTSIRIFGKRLGLIYKDGDLVNKSNTGTLDIRNTTDEYTLVFGKEDVIQSSTGSYLFTNIFNRDSSLISDANLSKLDENLILSFDMKTVNSSGQLLDISKNNILGTCKHNFGGIYDNRDFKTVGCGKPGGVIMNDKGVVFDGIGDAIEVPYLGLGENNWSIELMGNIEEIKEDVYVQYDGKKVGLHEWDKYVLVNPFYAGSDQRIYFNTTDKYIGIELAESADTGERRVDSNYDISDVNDLFYHIVVQRTANEVLFYINGNLVGKKEDINSNAKWLSRSFIGNRSTGQMPFKGTMKSFRVFDRILSENEIKSLYYDSVN